MAEQVRIEFGDTAPGVSLTDKPRPELTGPGNVNRIEFGRESPASFLQRAGASIPRTTEGQVTFLEQHFGAGNVKTTPRGEILIRDPATGALVPFDERGISFSDITADILGPALEAVPAGLGGLVAGPAGGLPGAAAGAAAGSVVRSGAARLLTGNEPGETVGEQALEAGGAALIGGIGQGAVHLGARVFDAFRPKTLLAKKLQFARDQPFAKKGARLSDETDIPLTMGQETGSRGVLAAEGVARRLPGSANDFFEFHQGQLRSAMSRLQDAMQKVKPESVGSFKTGTEVVNAFDDAMESAVTLRRAQAAQDFGEVTRLSSGAPIIPTRRLARELQDVIDELDIPGVGDATATAVRQSKALLKNLMADDAPRNLTAHEAQRLLQHYTNVQRGTASLFKDMPPKQQKLVVGRLRDAFELDLDDAVAQAGQAGDTATALRTARDRYRVNSVVINEMTNSTLAGLIGKRTASPEAIAEKLVTKMRPSEVRDIMAIIERTAPETAQSVRRLFIDHAMANAKPAVTQQAASGVRFSESKFLSNLPDLDVMKAAGFSRQEIVEIGRVVKVLQRVADKSFEGSPTAPFLITWDALRGLFTLNPVTLVKGVGTIMTQRSLSRLMLTPEGRQALLTVGTSGPKSKAAVRTAIALSAVLATEPGAENVRPMRPDDDGRADTMDSILKEGTGP